MSSNKSGSRNGLKGRPLTTKGLPPPPRQPHGGSSPHYDDQLSFSSPKKSAAKPSRLVEAMIDRVAPKIFVLDTNVLMHDPTAIFRFGDNDIVLPIVVLEELDAHKKGMGEVPENVRRVTRWLDELMALELKRNPKAKITDGIPLNALGHTEATGSLRCQTMAYPEVSLAGLSNSKNDNYILSVVQGMQTEHPAHRVVLVSKDINMRVKGRALGLFCEDYKSDMVLEDQDVLDTGITTLGAGEWSRLVEKATIQSIKATNFYHLPRSAGLASLVPNRFIYDPHPKTPFMGIVASCDSKGVVIRDVRSFMSDKHKLFGITAKNPEQNFALNLLMDPEIDLVMLSGQAGTGKTLLALAAGLQQTMDDHRYDEIIVTRVTVPLGEDIGFLPGTEEDKMGPWMGAFDDNLRVLVGRHPPTKFDGVKPDEWHEATMTDQLNRWISVKSMSFMRGRTFIRKFLILDEAQNLTPKQMKTLITRAGPGTKVVCLGNLAQIDTPYLTEGSSGLTYAVKRFSGWKHAGHVILMRGERSRLADHAVNVL